MFPLMSSGKDNDKLGKENAKLKFGIQSLQKAHSSQDRLNQLSPPGPVILQANLTPVKEEVLGENEDNDSDEEMQKAAVTVVVSIAQTVIGHMCGENNSIEVLGEHVKTVTDIAGWLLRASSKAAKRRDKSIADQLESLVLKSTLIKAQDVISNPNIPSANVEMVEQFGGLKYGAISRIHLQKDTDTRIADHERIPIATTCFLHKMYTWRKTRDSLKSGSHFLGLTSHFRWVLVLKRFLEEESATF